MDRVAGDVGERLGRTDEHRQTRTLVERRLEIAPRRFVHEHRHDAIPRVLEDAADDDPALRDEQAMRAQQIGIRDAAIERDARIVGGLDRVRSRAHGNQPR